MKKQLFITLLISCATTGIVSAQSYNDSGISAGFFDSSNGTGTINFTNFHLPPLAVLFENAKQNPQVLSLAKAEEIARAEVLKQKKHIFSYISGHASYSYGMTDMWGNNSTTYNPVVYQYQGSKQAYWNVGASLNIPVEDILDLGQSVKRKRLAAEQAEYNKDIAFDQLKLQIATLYVKITNDLVTLKSTSESAAASQGAGALNQEDFHNGNMDIAGFAQTKEREASAVSQYQTMQTSITTDILTLEILTHTPIITNSTTDVTLESYKDKDTRDLQKKQVAEEKKELNQRIKDDKKAEQAIEAKEKKAAEKALKDNKKNAKK